MGSQDYLWVHATHKMEETMKRFMLVLLAALFVAGTVFATPLETSLTGVAEALFIPNPVTDKTKVESWNSAYLRVSGQGLSPYIAMATGLGARDGAVIGYWCNMGIGAQGGKDLFWSLGFRINPVDIGFGLEGGLGGIIDVDNIKVRLEGSADIIFPLVDKDYATKDGNPYTSFGIYPKIGILFKDSMEAGMTFSLFEENRLVGDKTNTDVRFGPYFRWGKAEVGLIFSKNRWNLDKDNEPVFVTDIKLAFTL